MQPCGVGGQHIRPWRGTTPPAATGAAPGGAEATLSSPPSDAPQAEPDGEAPPPPSYSLHPKKNVILEILGHIIKEVK
jgi:hypothetical protein